MAVYKAEEDNGEWDRLFHEVIQAKKLIGKEARKTEEAGKWKKR